MSEEQKVTFAVYGDVFQQKIMQGFLSDPIWAEQMCEVFDPQFFDQKYLQYLSEKLFSYASKYKTFPTMQLLVTIISQDLKSEGSDKVLGNQIVDYLKKMRANPDPGDLPFVKEKALDFCKRQALKEALEKSVDMINTEKYESIVDIVQRAVMKGSSTTMGHDFFEDYEARFVKTTRAAIPTGLECLDAKDVMDGGLGAGELGVIMAPTGIGKCSYSTERICVKYVAIKANGKIYKPWDKISTVRGQIFARDLRIDDEITK